MSAVRYSYRALRPLLKHYIEIGRPTTARKPGEIGLTRTVVSKGTHRAKVDIIEGDPITRGQGDTQDLFSWCLTDFDADIIEGDLIKITSGSGAGTYYTAYRVHRPIDHNTQIRMRYSQQDSKEDPLG